jgi:dihydroorotase
MNGKIPLTRVAEVVAEEPATEFKLAEKGFLKPGYDADIMIFDPNDQTRHSADGVLSKCGWTAYDGRVTRGRVHRTMVRGRDVYVDGVVVGEPGWGRLARPAI